MNINEYLTIKQQEKIVKTILSKNKEYIEDNNLIEKHIHKEYAYKRKSYNLTTYVLSGFAPNVFNETDLEIKTIKYGIGLMQPELKTKNAIIHLYSHGADFKSKIIRDYCLKFNATEECPHYLIIVFEFNKETNIIENITLRKLDKNLNIQEQLTLYKSS